MRLIYTGANMVDTMVIKDVLAKRYNAWLWISTKYYLMLHFFLDKTWLLSLQKISNLAKKTDCDIFILQKNSYLTYAMK